MKHFWLAACAAGLLTAMPAQALEIRVDPAPLYVFDQADERGTFDLVLHNILIVNDDRRARDIKGLRVELRAKGDLVSIGRVSEATLERRAEQMSKLSDAGVLQTMDFQFHLSTLMRGGERLSEDARLERNEAYLNSGFYISASTLPDTARVVVEGPRGDIGHVDIPVSRYQSPVTYRAPADGRWLVMASGDAALHHRWVVSSEYAIDIIRTNADMHSYTGDGTKLSDYPTFGSPILAAASGVVVVAKSDLEDNAAMLRQPGEAFDDYMQRVAQLQQETLMKAGFEGAAGNYVLIRHENGEHSLYAHLKQGSVQVSAGQAVVAGEQIAQAGSSGNSTEPHLHFQLIDGPNLDTARGLPVTFSGLWPEWVSLEGRHLRSGDIMQQAD